MCVSTEERSRGDDYKSTTLFPSAREVSCNKIPASLRGKKEKSSACFSAEYQDSSKSPRVSRAWILGIVSYLEEENLETILAVQEFRESRSTRRTESD